MSGSGAHKGLRLGPSANEFLHLHKVAIAIGGLEAEEYGIGPFGHVHYAIGVDVGLEEVAVALNQSSVGREGVEAQEVGAGNGLFVDHTDVEDLAGEAKGVLALEVEALGHADLSGVAGRCKDFLQGLVSLFVLALELIGATYV